MNFIEKVKELANYIKNHDELELRDFIIEPPATQQDIQLAKDNGLLDKKVLDLYKQANGILLKWNVKESIALEKYQIEALYLEQGFYFLPLQNIFDDWKDFIWSEEKPDFKPLRPFNFYDEYFCDAFWIKQGEKYEQVDIYYVEVEESFHKLPFNFEIYLKKLLDTKGIWRWNSIFTNEPDPETIEIIKIAKQIFPDFDQEYYKI